MANGSGSSSIKRHWGTITWFEMGKQNIQTKKVYCRIYAKVCLTALLGSGDATCLKHNILS